MDITWILELVMIIIGFFVVRYAVPYFKSNEQTKVLVEIAHTVVAAANELDITGELLDMGMTKATYALKKAKEMLEAHNITFDDDVIIAYIKAAVTDLRIDMTDTSAEKKPDEDESVEDDINKTVQE